MAGTYNNTVKTDRMTVVNRTYREEMARRRTEEEQEMMDIIFAVLTEV